MPGTGKNKDRRKYSETWCQKVRTGCRGCRRGDVQVRCFPTKSTRDLFVEAFTEMKGTVDKGFDVADIDALYIGNFSSDLFEGQGHIATIMADWVGLAYRPATRVEGACASGGLALRQGIIGDSFWNLRYGTGRWDRENDQSPYREGHRYLAAASDVQYEATAGFTFPGLYAAMATAYMAKYGAKVEHFMKVGINNHNNGALNDKAQFGITIKDVMPEPGGENGPKGATGARVERRV